MTDLNGDPLPEHVVYDEIFEQIAYSIVNWSSKRGIPGQKAVLGK